MEISRDSLGVFVIAEEHPAVDGQASTATGVRYDVCYPGHTLTLNFQNGSPLTNGVNGITNESLLSILIHRLTLLNAKFACAENVKALSLLTQASKQLDLRTQDRKSRGVDGKLVP